MSYFQGFDPLQFLNITNLKDEEKDILSSKLLDKICQYISLRIAELLDKQELNKIEDHKVLLNVAMEKVPGLDKRIKEFLDDFKEEYYKNLNIRI